MRSFILATVVLPLAGVAIPAQGPARAPLQVTEWRVPWEKSRPRDPYLDAQGRVWFVGQEGNYVAYLAPSTGSFRRYEIEKGTNPHSLIVDRGGRVWFSGNRNARIGSLDPASGKSTIYPRPGESYRD